MTSRSYALATTALSFVGLAAILYLMSLKASRTPENSIDTTFPPLGSLADFKLTDQNDQAFGLENLQGKFWIADFIFTSCPGICKDMSSNMSEIRRTFPGDPRLNFVSISVDPETDTPAVLREYADRYNADDRWHFLTGESDAIQAIATKNFKVGGGEDHLVHSPHFVLVDPEGQIRNYYNGTEPGDVEKIKADVTALLANSL
jgi:protein SCO1/2